MYIQIENDHILDENTIQYIKIAKVNYEAWPYAHFSLVIGKTAAGVGE